MSEDFPPIMQRARKSLAESAAEVRKGCWVCSIPERGEIDEWLSKSGSVSAVVRWLYADCGYANVTRERVRYHAEAGHYRS